MTSSRPSSIEPSICDSGTSSKRLAEARLALDEGEIGLEREDTRQPWTPAARHRPREAAADSSSSVTTGAGARSDAVF
jgi:hypothetical protein